MKKMLKDAIFMLIAILLLGFSVCAKSRGNLISPPESGCYVGVFPGWGELEDSINASKLNEFENLSGKGVAFSPFSNFWGENYIGTEQLSEFNTINAVPCIRLMPWGDPYWTPGYQDAYSLNRIIEGEFDQFLRDWAQAVIDFEKPVMMTFGVEMNGDWFPWSGIFQGADTTDNYGDPSKADGPERYVEAFRHIINLFNEAGADNVTWYFHPNYQSFPDESWNAISAYYPGDDYIDWVAFSLYGAQSATEPWVTFQDVMDPIYDIITANFPNKPLMIAEYGVREWTDSTFKAQWYNDAFNMLKNDYPEIKIAIVYHEKYETAVGDTADLRINSSPQALQAYQTGVGDDYYIGTLETED